MYRISNFASETESIDLILSFSFLFPVVQSETYSYEDKALNTYGKMPKKVVVRLIAFWQRLSSRFTTRKAHVKYDLRGRAQEHY